MRRESVVERIQWDDETHDRVKSLGLKLAYITRTSLQHEDIENRMFEMRPPSGRYIVTFRCETSAEADIWFESVHSCACALLTQALAQVNLMLGQNPQVRRMGWVAEQVWPDARISALSERTFSFIFSSTAITSYSSPVLFHKISIDI
ncbi:hypothetical protein AB6A40_011401 [Gnathostoma spinigerum]|uniref:Syntrophin split Pleckstrin homology (PH) domain-containing protein n=1 Tax=Gnathostoma spinigerum TaxID=75299 RepID=A0ABD6F415_9BILA